ncbi:MAG: endopeptidase La [Pseudomonadales bacterium]|nr:endopeptidase La [Pseudomonadales bacterium]
MKEEADIEVLPGDDKSDSSVDLALPNEILPEKLYVIPVATRPFFPAQIQPVVVDKDRWQGTLQRVAKAGHNYVGLVYVGDIDVETASVDDCPAIGCVVRLHNVTMVDDQMQLVAQGIKRFKIESWISERRPMLASVSYPTDKQKYIDEQEELAEQTRAHGMALLKAIKELLPLNPMYPEELKQYLSQFSPNDPSPLADFAAAITTAKGVDLQDILETIPLLARMKKVLVLLHKETEVAQLQTEITAQINQKAGEQQREFFLREQLKIIQKELGIEKDDKTADTDEFRSRLENRTVPQLAQKRIDEELKKLSMLQSGSPEFSVTRNYLDWLTTVPWGVHSKDNLELSKARELLDSHHDGLQDVKERIIEFLALGAFKGEVSGSIILLVGPPGVGKTSIGKSIADTLGRKFYRFSVGGMRDEAEIKGHRRTYIGAMPGKFVQALKQVEVENPVIMLDEIDKIGASYQGDPASALLEALDPEQNSNFLDHYLDVPIDLSNVLFVCTANQLDSIPGPLLDRMETIRLAGYITEEKLGIAKNYLLPKAMKKAGLKARQLRIARPALRKIIEQYAREAGVRNLEKQLQRIIRKAVVRLLEQPDEPVRVGVAELEDFLGPPTFRDDRLINGTGVVTGLAWTSMGGATLPIEATRVHTKNRGFKLTGKLGDVMKESAEIAYSYVVSNLKEYGCPEDFFDTSYIHIHVPEGATPKDGPSAGITLATALLSLARQQRIKKPLAMTGELTLTGQVLAVGGIREKIIAARRSKINQLILPEACRWDFEELPDYLKANLSVLFADHYRDVFEFIFK